MKILAIIFMLTSVFFKTTGELDINYNPKVLQGNLKKITGLENNSLKELGMRDQQYLNGKFFTVNGDNASKMFVYIGRVNSCRADGCSIDRSEGGGEFEFFDYYIIFDSSKKVLQVNVFNYEATHGQEITARGWLKQFTGYDGQKEMKVGKNIDAISGATISVHGIVEDVKEKTRMLNND